MIDYVLRHKKRSLAKGTHVMDVVVSFRLLFLDDDRRSSVRFAIIFSIVEFELFEIDLLAIGFRRSFLGSEAGHFLVLVVEIPFILSRIAHRLRPLNC